MISPPVALAAFTAAKLSETPPMATAWAACRFGWPAFIVPFLFVIAPNLIMVGSALDIALTFVTAVAGIWIASAGFTGYFLTRLNMTHRIIYIVGGFFLLLPTEAFEGAVAVQVAGAILSGAGLAWELKLRRQVAT